MTLATSQYLTVDVPYVPLLPKYRPQLDTSLPPKDDPKILVCFILPEKLTEINFLELPHPPLKMNTPLILNDSTSRNSVDLNQVNMEAKIF
jgi:hypothetical protein